MKTIFRKCFSLLAVVAMVSSVALLSCTKDEVTPVPDDVEDTIENVYYITGIVTTSSGALSGATVTSGSVTETTNTDGAYTLEVSSSATATVNFSCDGYVSIDATAIFTNGATVGDAVILSQELTAKVEAQTVTAGEDIILVFNNDLDSDPDSETDIVVSIPSTALTEDVEISATSYIPTATDATAVALAEVTENGGTTTVVSTLSAVNLEPSGTTFETPVTISIPGDYIEGAYHAKLVDGEWVKQGDVSYNATTGAYEMEVYGFSQHSIAVESEVSVTSSSSSSDYVVTLLTEEINNIGMVDAISETISYTQSTGWEFSGDSSLTTYVSSLMGGSANVYTMDKSLDVKVAGDEKLTITITQQIVDTEYTLGAYSATARSYGNVTVSLVTEQGNMRPDHNN